MIAPPLFESNQALPSTVGGVHSRLDRHHNNNSSNSSSHRMDSSQQPEQGEVMEVDMGYEEHHPTPRRRGSMSHDEEKQRRASIKAILADETISPMQKRKSIQHLMDGRRNSLTGGSTGTTPSSCNVDSLEYGDPTTTTPNGFHGSTSPMNDHHTTKDASSMEYEDMEMVSRAGYSMCNEYTQRAENSRPPCSHYERQCTIISPCCGAAFGCRICHDDCPSLPPKFNNGGRRFHRSASLPSSFTSMNAKGNNNTINSTAGTSDPNAQEETHHNIDRFAIREVICRQCYTRQSSKTNNCVNCGVQFGAYHCNICNLWMSNDETPYHCQDCGFCRVGGAENFQHCHLCGMCIDKTLFDCHNCKADKYRSNCPVCQEFLFSSRSASHEMPCGHAIHWECFRQLAAHDSRCPVCKKTAETRDRMMPTWQAMAAGVALQPVPPELARVVSITCNDCEKSAEARAWHFLGIQCLECSSFNTVVDKIVMTGVEAHAFLEQLEPHPRDITARRRRPNRRRSLY